MKIFDKIKRPKRKLDKKGYSTGFTWIFGLVSLFGIGILYIVFNQVFVGHLVPVIKGMANDTSITNIDNATVQEIYSGIDKYMDFFHALPFILFFVIVVYMFIAAIRKEREEVQY